MKIISDPDQCNKIWSRYNKKWVDDFIAGLKRNPRPMPQGLMLEKGIIYDLKRQAFLLNERKYKEIIGE